MSNAANAALASPWKDLWNGDLDVISQIIAEDFVAHAAPLTGTGTTEMHGRQALSGWVSSCGGKRKATTVAASRARRPRPSAGTPASPAPTSCASLTASSQSIGPTPTACCSSSSSVSARCPPADRPKGDLRTADRHLNGRRRRIRMHATNSPSTGSVGRAARLNGIDDLKRSTCGAGPG